MDEKGKVLGMFSKSLSEAAHRDTLIRVLADGHVPGNDAIIDQLIARDYSLHSPLGDLGRDGLTTFLRALRNALADFSMVQAQVLRSGDFAATRTILSGVFARAFPGPSGVGTIVRFNLGAQIAEEWMQFDYLDLLRQWGAGVSTPSVYALLQ